MSDDVSRLLVIGGRGFIGGHVVAHAVRLGWRVTSLSLSRDGGTIASGVTYLSADIRDQVALRDCLLPGRFEYVVNCGGYVDHRGLANDGRSVLDAHFLGLVNLIALLDRGVLRSLINIGSSDEYGNLPAPQREDVREAPISVYSAAKVAATHMLQMLHRAEALPTTTVRLFLAYGPGQSRKRFLPQIVAGCLRGAPFPVSRGEQLRDFCYIDDVVAAIFAIFHSASAQGEVINVASGAPIAISSVVEAVAQLVGAGAPQFGAIPYRPSESMALYADISKAGRLLGWKPEVGLAEGLRRTIDWTVRNP